jgi:Domain of unknown function (DUF4347)
MIDLSVVVLGKDGFRPDRSAVDAMFVGHERVLSAAVRDMVRVKASIVQTVPTTELLVCDSPDDMIAQLRALVGETGRIDRLDIVEHGKWGAIAMGDRCLWQSDADPLSPLAGSDAALTLAPLLSDTAQVRLLGCVTGAAAAGRMLLVKLQQALGGHRVVYGAIDRLQPSNFQGGRLKPSAEATLLFTSAAAIDGEAPTFEDRLDHRASLRPRVVPHPEGVAPEAPPLIRQSAL